MYFSKRYFVAIILLLSIYSVLYAQGTYYDNISTSSPTLINDIKTRIRSPYTKVSYDNFDETNIANFASWDNGNGTRSVQCVYSSEIYTYTPPFSWLPFSREHTWCHSWMPTNPSTSGNEYADQHHLFPTNQNNVNGVRANHPLGIVNTITSSYLDAKYGKDSNNNNVYEPRNVHKGDAARAILYMSIRYDGVNGYNWTFSNLSSIMMGLSEFPQSQEILKSWHQQDPPDKWEVDRNNYIQSIQGNRNPFVDHPEYVSYINFYNFSQISPSLSTEPTNHVTSFSSGAVTNNSIEMTWTDSIAGSQAPSGYLLMGYNKNDYFIPMDGIAYADDSNFSDGKAVVNITYAGADNFNFTGLTNNTPYYFRIYSYNGSGTSINYKITTTVPSSIVTTSSVSLATEPTNHVTNFNIGSVTTNSIQVTWTDSVGSQLPSGYLLLTNNNNNFTNPQDGLTYSDDSNLGDGSARINVTHPSSGTHTFSSLSSNVTYYFRMYPYNGLTTQRNYKTGGTIPSTNAVTQLIPSVLTQDVTNITPTTATGHGYITYLGSSNPSQHGIVWNTSPNPTIALGTKTQNGSISTTGAFTGSLTGLSAQTLYYVRAYATNASGTGYGDDVTFYTLSNEPSSHAGSFTATAISQTQIDLSWTSAAGANGYLILQKQGSNPTGVPEDGQAYIVNNVIGDSIVVAVITSGSITNKSITGLSSGTNYYYSIIPYGYNGSNFETYNYRTTTTIPTANATTLSPSGPPVIINEFSQGASGAKEWVEILVVEDNFNLQNYKLTDDNGSLSITLSGSGFSSIEQGTLIVIYNGGDVDGLITPDLSYNGTSDKSLQISSLNNSGSFALTRTTGWNGTTGAFGNGSATDLPKLLNSFDSVVFVVPVSPAPNANQFTAYLGNTSSGATSASNWSTNSTSTGATPGLPNGGLNTDWINITLPVELSFFEAEPFNKEIDIREP